MKADMHIMNLFNARKPIAENKEPDLSTRRKCRVNDKIEKYKRVSSPSDYRHPENSESASFKETYDTVSREEHEKCKSDQRIKSCSVKDDTGKKVREKRQADEMTKLENLIASEAAEKKEIGIGKISFEQAKKIIQNSLAVISEKLNLNINYSNGLSDLNFNVLSDAVTEQFSEILYALKSISQLLENAVAKNVALEVKGVVIEPHKAAMLEQSLRVELFRLQVALEALGVVGDVSKAVALKMNKPADGGIPKATDPSSLFMPESQIKQLLGNLMETREDQVTSVIERMTALAKAQNPENVEAEKNLGKRITAFLKSNDKDLSLRVTGVSSGKNSNPVKAADLCTFDPQVIRHLLKIDDSGQKLSVEGNTDGKPTVVNLTSSTMMSSNQNLQQVLNASLNSIEQISAIETSAKGEGQPVDLSVKLPAMPFKSLEESVMTQVTQRLSNAIKSGMHMHEIRLVLRPESLGDMRMTIQMDGDVVMARIIVENQQVKQIIESNLQALRDSLEEQNLQAGAFDVNVNKGNQNEERETLASEKDIRILKTVEELADEALNINLTAGTETGRRFGSNSIEYFA